MENRKEVIGRVVSVIGDGENNEALTPESFAFRTYDDDKLIVFNVNKQCPIVPESGMGIVISYQADTPETNPERSSDWSVVSVHDLDESRVKETPAIAWVEFTPNQIKQLKEVFQKEDVVKIAVNASDVSRKFVAVGYLKEGKMYALSLDTRGVDYSIEMTMSEE